MSPSPKEGSPGSMMKGGEGGSGAHTPVNPYIHPLVLTRTHSHPLVDSRDVLLFDGDTDWKTDAVPASIPYASTSPPPSVFYPYGPHPMKPVGLAQLAHDYKYTGQDGDQKEAFPSPPSATYYLPPLPFTATAANTTSSSLSSSVPASSLLPPPGRSSLPVTVQEVNSLKSGWRFGVSGERTKHVYLVMGFGDKVVVSGGAYFCYSDGHPLHLTHVSPSLIIWHLHPLPGRKYLVPPSR